MFEIGKQIIKDWFTGPDGVTYDPARSLWFVGVVAFLIFTSHSVFFNKKDFDMVNFGIAFSGLLAAGAVGVKIKESTEPSGSRLTIISPPAPLPPPAPIPPPLPTAPLPAAPIPVVLPAPVVKPKRKRIPKIILPPEKPAPKIIEPEPAGLTIDKSGSINYN